MLTVANCEEALAEEVGPYFAVCKLDSVPTLDGTNKAMRGPIRDGVITAGGSLQDWPSVTDADLETIQVGPAMLMKLIIIRALEKCWGNWPKWDQSDGDGDWKLRQLGDALEKRIKALKDDLASDDGTVGGVPIVASAPEIGYIDAGSFMPNDPYRWRSGPFPY